MHQVQERERRGSAADGMLRENATEPLRLVAQLPADRLLRVGREVALREELFLVDA